MPEFAKLNQNPQNSALESSQRSAFKLSSPCQDFAKRWLMLAIAKGLKGHCKGIEKSLQRHCSVSF